MKRWLSPLLLVALTNCALITGGPNQTIQVSSKPAGARAVLTCDGKTLGTTDTPGSITLRRRHDACALQISKPGFNDDRLTLERNVRRAFWGNFGIMAGSGAAMLAAIGNNLAGLIAIPISLAVGGGAILIDMLSGAIYDWTPHAIESTLVPTSQAATPSVPEASSTGSER